MLLLLVTAMSPVKAGWRLWSLQRLSSECASGLKSHKEAEDEAKDCCRHLLKQLQPSSSDRTTCIPSSRALPCAHWTEASDMDLKEVSDMDAFLGFSAYCKSGKHCFAESKVSILWLFWMPCFPSHSPTVNRQRPDYVPKTVILWSMHLPFVGNFSDLTLYKLVLYSVGLARTISQ